MLDSFFWDASAGDHTTQAVQASHAPALMGLSLLIALGCTWAALSIDRNAYQAHNALQRHVSGMCAALVMGFGIWGMHFVGMLALQLPFAVHYDPSLTVLSAVPAIVGSWCALRIIAMRRHSLPPLLLAGSVLGLAIGVMHYTGLAAMQMPATLHFMPVSFMASALAGITLPMLAFALHRRVRQRKGWLELTLPALLLSTGMACMHYLSMHAALFTAVRGAALPLPSTAPPMPAASTQTLAWVIAVSALTVAIVLLLAIGALKYRLRWQEVAASDARFKAMVDTSVDGVIAIDTQGTVHEFNPAAQQIFGYEAHEVIGANVSMLMPSPIAEQHDHYLSQSLQTQDRPVRINGRELMGMRKDGRLVPLLMAISRVQTPSGMMFIGYVTDMTESKRREAQLRIATSVFEHVREGIAIIDVNLNIADVNPAFCHLMDAERKRFIGRPLDELYMHARPAPNLHKMWQTVASDHYWQGEILLSRSNGMPWTQRLSVSPVLNKQQRPDHYIAVISDVSAHTGTHNRRAQAPAVVDAPLHLPQLPQLRERLEQLLPHARDKQQWVGLVCIELLPQSGNAASAPAADTAVQALARMLQQSLRPTDFLALTAPTTLMLALPGLQSSAGFNIVRSRLLRLCEFFSNSDSCAGFDVPRMGWALYPEVGQNAETLLAQALAHLHQQGGSAQSVAAPTPAPWH